MAIPADSAVLMGLGGKESGEVKVNMATGEGGHLTGNTYGYQ